MTEPRVVTTEPQVLAAIRETIAMADIRTFFDRGFGDLMDVLGAQGVTPTGPGLAVYWGVPTDSADLAIALPTAGPVEPTGRVAPIELAATRAAEVVHEGGYDSLSNTYRDLQQWIVDQDLVPGDVVWETYLTEPTPDADPADMRTQVTWTLRGAGA
ncbi:GyrI-like domain-containing protein [Aeromicrobium sp. CF3.5]|uniref:GyrI-like domain-containing protein n=1 Tax=Aeromicrobium sp. CF3.5 TaxID=3373078 RepID=UPI003EE4B445